MKTKSFLTSSTTFSRTIFLKKQDILNNISPDGYGTERIDICIPILSKKIQFELFTDGLFQDAHFFYPTFS